MIATCSGIFLLWHLLPCSNYMDFDLFNSGTSCSRSLWVIYLGFSHFNCSLAFKILNVLGQNYKLRTQGKIIVKWYQIFFLGDKISNRRKKKRPIVLGVSTIWCRFSESSSSSRRRRSTFWPFFHQFLLQVADSEFLLFQQCICLHF